MHGGISVGRHAVLLMPDGTIVVDWGDGTYQDIDSGKEIPQKADDLSFPVREQELEWLKRTGKVSYYDGQVVFLIGLPEHKPRAVD